MMMLAGWQQISYGVSTNILVKLYHIRLNSINRIVIMVFLENISVLYLCTGSSAKLPIKRLEMTDEPHVTSNTAHVCLNYTT